MKLRILKTPAADGDLAGHAEYIATDSVERALAFLDCARRTIEELAEYPSLGKPAGLRRKKTRDLRMRLVRKHRRYVILYRVTRNEILIVRVLHGAMDISKVMER